MTLAEYLELPLRNGGGLFMMQQCDDVFGMYVGNAAEGQADVTFYGTVAATIATGILRLTKVGRNRIEIAEYYIVRSLTHFEDRGAALPIFVE
ncbi:hypothetical protein [Paraburkholderia hospita]|nr:hypothetical protein [Paraburkholderia hospita]SKD05036.1 hypothetical protein SAMN05446934_9510 [Paraburkholderia hospita]